MSKMLERTTFTTSRLLEFFSEKELSMQIGHSPGLWPLALLKELIDNALDACETAGIPPQIDVIIEQDAISVRDNGPGLSESVLKESLDYMVRVSDKNHYVSPTRGQLGNALKCVWAAPFVIDGEEGQIDVITGGKVYTILVTLDRIEQAPRLELNVRDSDDLVKTGTFLKMHWSAIACSLSMEYIDNFYKDKIYASTLLERYAAFNPHASFTCDDLGHHKAIEATTSAWRKWVPNNPTSPHWYTLEKIRALVAAYVSDERNGGKVRTVREFVSEFSGLSSTIKQKRVTESVGLSGAYLHDLVNDNDVKSLAVHDLLKAMQTESRPVKSRALGELGKEHLTAWLENNYCDSESVRYKSVSGEADGLPFVLEAAFAVHTGQYEDCHGDTITGLNWTPMLSIPFSNLWSLLGENRIDDGDPVKVIVHLACPRLEFTDRGKSRLDLPEEIGDALATAVRLSAKDWKKAKRQADRDNRVRRHDLEQLRKAEKSRKLTVKEAAWQVMVKAYMKASANNTLPANARQIMYAARGDVIKLTGKTKPWKNSSYFTQRLLPDFVDTYPELTANWDVVYDARGKLMEPHTGRQVDLGTLAVRRYRQQWTNGRIPAVDQLDLPHSVDTIGPTFRYKYALFVEKEGFNELFRAVNLGDRFDLAIMSTKGMSVTAARRLVEWLTEQGVTILVLHDFDKAGFSILSTLRGDTRRYQYKTTPNIVDLGLRLTDVEAMGLDSEEVQYEGKKDPRENLRESGATEAECDFLVKERDYRGWWHGDRVELNAMTSDQLIAWLETKLETVGVKKVIPDMKALEHAYRRAVGLAKIQKAIDNAQNEFDPESVEIPENLRDDLERKLEYSSTSWDEALYSLALYNLVY